jgi:hypothetical protein
MMLSSQACTQPQSTSLPSIEFPKNAPELQKVSWSEQFQYWVNLPAALDPNACEDEYIVWFLSKRANGLINSWLMNKRLSILKPVSPNNTGCIIIPRAAVEHVVESRTVKDNVTLDGVTELLEQIFVLGSAKFSPNTTYLNQLYIFDATYKAKNDAAAGESPAAAISFQGAPFAHFRLETAYWMRPKKIQQLDAAALKK